MSERIYARVGYGVTVYTAPMSEELIEPYGCQLVDIGGTGLSMLVIKESLTSVLAGTCPSPLNVMASSPDWLERVWEAQTALGLIRLDPSWLLAADDS